MSTVKFNDFISIYFFNSYPFNWKHINVPNLWNFWEMFSSISFLKNFSRMKRWWREELQLPVTIKRSFLISYKGKKCSSDVSSFDAFRNKFFANLISCFKSFSLNENDLWILSDCFSERNVCPPGKWAEIRERIASESLQKIHTKFYEVAGHVWVELKL